MYDECVQVLVILPTNDTVLPFLLDADLNFIIALCSQSFTMLVLGQSLLRCMDASTECPFRGQLELCFCGS